MKTLYTITVEITAEDPAAKLRALRFFLKRLGRSYGLKCKKIETTTETTAQAGGEGT